MTFLALALLLATAQPGDSYTLQWKLKEGDTFFAKRETRLESSISIDGKPSKDESAETVVLRFQVKSAAARATVVEMTYLMIERKTEKVTHVDFPKAKTFTGTLDDKMKVTKFEGYDKFLDAITDGDEARKKVVRTMTAPERMFRREFDETFPADPGKPVAIGATWDQTESTSWYLPFGTMDAKLTRKLDSVKGDVASVVTKGDLTWRKGDETLLGLKVIKAEMKAEKYAHSYGFDMKAGRPLDSKLEMDLNLTMTLEAAGMPLEWKSKKKVTVITTISDKHPLKD